MAIRISVLDEDLLARQGMAGLLPGFGIEVVGEYGRAEPFLLGLLKDLPQVAVVDCFQSPQGLGLLLAIWERHPNLPVVVLTSRCERGLLDECVEAGVAALLDKTEAGFELLANAIAQVAEGKRLCSFDALKIGGATRGHEEPELVRILSPREREVLAHLAVGEDNLKIAACLGISERTVKAHVCNLYRKLGQENRTQMALLARQLGIRPATNVRPTAAPLPTLVEGTAAAHA